MPAMPVTTVRKMTGVMIILTSLMKPSPSGFSARPKSGNSQPTSTPSAIADQHPEIERPPERPSRLGHFPSPHARAGAVAF